MNNKNKTSIIKDQEEKIELENKNSYHLDEWIVLKLPNNFYKVFGTWDNRFVEHWRINSGITKIEQDENFYYFYGYSGSCYKCNKKDYGITSTYGQLILEKILMQDQIEALPDRKDWTLFKI